MNNKYKIIKLSAVFCNPCKTLSNKLQELNLLDKIESYDIDTPEGAAFVKDYSIRGVPSVVIIDNDTEEFKVYSGDKCLNAIQVALGEC